MKRLIGIYKYKLGENGPIKFYFAIVQFVIPPLLIDTFHQYSWFYLFTFWLIFTERLSALLPEEQKLQIANLVPPNDFEVAYRLECRNLCGDFQEDIQFRFSLGITSLMHRFLGPRGRKAILMGYSDAVSVTGINFI